MVTPKADANAEPFRCHCGSLLARLVADGVEIKCRRCKRRVVVPLSASAVEDQDRADSGVPSENP